MRTDLVNQAIQTGNTGVWGQISDDTDLGIVYLPTEMPTNDYYGGHRHGDNLFADSIVAVDLETGDRIWHYQAGSALAGDGNQAWSSFWQPY